MTQAAALLDRVRSHGFTVRVVDSRLLVAPIARLPDDLRAELRAAKPELLALLAANDDAVLTDDERDAWIERASIAEYDGNMSRAAAEALAWEAWRIGRLP